MTKTTDSKKAEKVSATKAGKSSTQSKAKIVKSP
jgi:hypothetical protein